MSTTGMDPSWFIERLDAFGSVPKLLLGGLDAESALWRPSEEDWSIVEIVSHLVDEEIEDFRMRLRLTLEDPIADWPPIDPVRVARERNYRNRTLNDMLAQFQSVRMESVAWLRSLPRIDVDVAHKDPRFESMSAGDLLASWCAHDALHLRQLARRLHGLSEHRAHPHHIGYAGEWPDA